MINSIENAYPYILFILLIFAFWSFELKYKKTRKLEQFTLISLSLIYIFFLGFRGFVGYDFYNYYTEYWNPLPIVGESHFWTTFFSNNYIDLGFKFYLLIIKNIWNNYSFFIFINTSIDWLLIVYFLRRYTTYYSFSLMIFLVMGGLIFEIDFIRNFKSILLFILSLKYIEKQKATPFFILNLLGFSFHSSALIYFPFYYFISKKINFYWYLPLYICSNILFLFHIPFLKYILLPLSNLLGEGVSILVARYFENGNFSSYGFSIGYIERTSVALLCFYFYKQFLANKRNLISINFLLYYLLLFLLSGEVREVTLRLPYLFFFSYAVVIPQIYILAKKKISKQLLITTILIYSVFKVYGLVGLDIYQYENILIGKYKSIEERQLIKDDFFMHH